MSIIKEFKGQLETLKQKKSDASGYVIVGETKDSEYTFVGVDNGYKNGPLFPESTNPQIFGSEKEATEELNSRYDFFDGRGQKIVLRIEKAEEFFERHIQKLQKSIDIIEEWANI